MNKEVIAWVEVVADTVKRVVAAQKDLATLRVGASPVRDPFGYLTARATFLLVDGAAALAGILDDVHAVLARLPTPETIEPRGNADRRDSAYAAWRLFLARARGLTRGSLT